MKFSEVVVFVAVVLTVAVAIMWYIEAPRMHAREACHERDGVMIETSGGYTCSRDIEWREKA